MKRKLLLTGFSLFVLGCALFLNSSRIQAQQDDTADFQSFKNDLMFVLGKTQSALLFTPFGSNSTFTKHKVTFTQAKELCVAAAEQAKDGSKCGNLGINFGTVYSLADRSQAENLGMNYTLEIADGGKINDVIKTIGNHPGTAIVRIGVADTSIGFQKWNANPGDIAGDYINYLSGIGNGTTKKFYAIAGPNEPDIENWFAPECGRAPGEPSDESDKFFTCIGEPLAKYMNAVCAAKSSGRIPGNIMLLSPAFNLTSYTFSGIFNSMKNNGANFSCLDAFAGNLYPAGQSMEAYWNDQERKFGSFDNFQNIYGKPLIITETGPMRQYLDNVGEFFITPLEGITPHKSVSLIRNDLVKQGYEAYCAMPERAISPAISGQISEFFGEEDFKMSPVFMMDMASAQYPIFRDDDRKEKLKADFEEYWSYQEDSGSDYSHSELGSAPIESLLSEEQRCVQGVKNLLAQEYMCNTLADSSTCALFAETVPSTSQTVKTLLDWYKTEPEAINSSAKDAPKNVCKNLSDERSSGNPDEKKLKRLESLSQVPLSVQKGYRLAFLLVRITNLKERNALFSFFAHESPPRDEVITIAFKIPDVITNKPQDLPGLAKKTSKAYPSFSDGAMLTRDSLQTAKQQEARINEETNRRIQLETKFQEVDDQSVLGEQNAIYCLDGPEGGAGSEACKDNLVKALTDMVNAQVRLTPDHMVCPGDDEIDDAYTILDPTSLGKISPTPIFGDELGSDLLKNLFTTIGITGLDTASRTFNSDFLVNAGNKENPGPGSVKVNMYLVYPVGYELNSIQEILTNSFLTGDQIATLEADKNLNERFEVQGGASSLTDNSHETKFKAFYPSWCDETNMLKCFRTTLEYSGKPIQIIGARLGYYMRAIQRTLAKEKSNVQEYLASCETVEEFLLDRCAGVGQKEPQSSITYCGMKELAITNSSTSQFTVCRTNAPAANCEPIAPGSDSYFLDRSSSHSLQIATRILDGATLITTGSVVTMSPGQDQNTETSSSRCGVSPENLGTGTQIWYLPPDVPESEIRNENTWIEKGSKFTPITGTKEWTNVVISLQVKPGYYMLPSETFGCLSRGASWAGKDGQESQERFILGSSVIPVGIGSKGRESYCAKATYNSNMPGGPGGDFYKTESYGCSINKPGFNLKLNNSCGGLNSSFENISFWRDLLSPDDENGSNKVPGLAMYEKMFGRKFVIPGGDGSCDSLFPNTIREVPCDQVDNNDVGTVANFGKEINFDIEYWSGSTINFKLPPQEVWSAINAASAKHFCDPYLVLAVANSESPTYSNTSESSAGALGVFQFIPGFTPEGKRRSWETWKVGNAASASCVNQHQPPTFTGKTDELSFSSPTDIPSAADSACRLILWTGAQRHLDDKQAFINAFSIQGENAQNQIWNNHTPQAEYVWRLWNKLLSETGKTAIPQPADYPPNCGQ